MERETIGNTIDFRIVHEKRELKCAMNMNTNMNVNANVNVTVNVMCDIVPCSVTVHFVIGWLQEWL